MMQVLCKPSQEAADVSCPVCGQGFLLFWERTGAAQRAEARRGVEQTLRDHHGIASPTAHPASPFNVPRWPRAIFRAGLPMPNWVLSTSSRVSWPGRTATAKPWCFTSLISFRLHTGASNGIR